MRSSRKRSAIVVVAVAALVVLLAAAALLVRWVLLGGPEKPLVPISAEAGPSWQAVRGPLIRAHWKQDGLYAAFSPRHELLGCWSVAFAQVLAYHRLEPKGRVSYRTRGGLTIDRLLAAPVAWADVLPAIHSNSSAEAARETATYLTDVAVVVQKDFGRGEYMDVSRIPAEVAEHYGVRVERVTSGIPEIVRSELRSGRPLIAYVDNILGIPIVRNGHAMVFDGMAEDAGRLIVHINFGWGGASDGWYPLAALAQERELLYVFRVAP